MNTAQKLAELIATYDDSDVSEAMRIAGKIQDESRVHRAAERDLRHRIQVALGNLTPDEVWYIMDEEVQLFLEGKSPASGLVGPASPSGFSGYLSDTPETEPVGGSIPSGDTHNQGDLSNRTRGLPQPFRSALARADEEWKEQHNNFHDTYQEVYGTEPKDLQSPAKDVLGSDFFARVIAGEIGYDVNTRKFYEIKQYDEYCSDPPKRELPEHKPARTLYAVHNHIDEDNSLEAAAREWEEELMKRNNCKD